MVRPAGSPARPPSSTAAAAAIGHGRCGSNPGSRRLGRHRRAARLGRVDEVDPEQPAFVRHETRGKRP